MFRFSITISEFWKKRMIASSLNASILLILVPSGFLTLIVALLLRNKTNHSLPTGFAAELQPPLLLLASAKLYATRRSSTGIRQNVLD
jgi:hypothetical protein